MADSRARVDRAPEEGVLIRDFHDFPQIHHNNPVRNMPDNPEIMRDKQIGQLEFGLRDFIRLRTCAWMDTSSAETASSLMISLGFTDKERAIPIRRCPPLNSCGYRLA